MVAYNELYNDKKVYYEILDDGFKIYIGQTNRPSIHQYEPYIPDPSKSYEENALAMCKDLCETGKESESVENRLLSIEANIDYLMLLSDAESAEE